MNAQKDPSETAAIIRPLSFASRPFKKFETGFVLFSLVFPYSIDIQDKMLTFGKHQEAIDHASTISSCG
jgi:hypothetical protein